MALLPSVYLHAYLLILASSLLHIPAQDVTFLYTGSHLSELQICTLIFSEIFILFSYLNKALHHLVIELCRALIIFLFFTVI